MTLALFELPSLWVFWCWLSGLRYFLKRRNCGDRLPDGISLSAILCNVQHIASAFLIACLKGYKICRCALLRIAASLHIDIFLRGTNVTAVQMPRKRITLNVDTRIADALAAIADRLGISVSRVGELELSKHLVELGELPNDYKPLGETRGGDFTGKKVKVDRATDEAT